MKKFVIMLFLSGILFSCDSDDDHIDDEFGGEPQDYEILAVGNSAIKGKATFEEQEDGSTFVRIDLEGIDEDETYTTAIYFENAADGGELAIELEEVDGETGSSITKVTELKDETPLSYEDIIELDGHILVFLLLENSERVVAQGDIGENYFSGKDQTYYLDTVGEEGSTGEMILQERINGEILVTLKLDKPEAENQYPAHIHSGAIGEEQGPSIYSLNPVDGETGMSYTNLTDFEDEEEDIELEDLLEFNGSINVYLNEDLEIIIAHGNIGSNSEE